MKVILFGAGRRCRILINVLRKTNIEILAVVDSNFQENEKKIDEYIIEPVEVLEAFTDYYVCVTFYSSLEYDMIWNQLEDKGFKKNKIISFNDLLLIAYKESFKQIKANYSYVESKIIFDGSWPMKLGGVESWLRTIVPALRNTGVNKVYIATESKDYKNTNGEVLDFCLYETPNYSYEYINRCIGFLYQNLPCTIVFSRVDELLLAAALIKNKRPDAIRIIMVDHGSCDGMYRDILSYREYIDFYVCVSTGIKDRLIEYGEKAEKIEIMTCPVVYDEKIDRSYSEDKCVPIKIGYAGRLEIFEKRIDILQKVICELELRKVNYTLDIAGTGTQFGNLKNFIEQKGLNNRIKMLGQLSNSDMPDFWKKHDVALITSDNEGRPLSNMEAMANGAVPVVTKTIGILDDVHDGYNGYIVPLNDAEAMAERISYLSEHRRLIKEFGENARKEMIGKISLNKHVEQWIRILEKVE